MGAKFKATLDSCCFAEMEEQHFPLPLPPCLFILCFALVQPSLFLFLSRFHCFPPLFFISLFFQKTRINSFSSTSFSSPFSLLSLSALALSPALISFSIFDSVVHLVLRSPLVLAFSLFVSQFSFHQICQSFKSNRD